MPTAPTVLRPDALATAELAEQAAAALRAGELAVLPTETVYGLFAWARDRAAASRLRELTPAPEGVGWTAAWHAPAGEAILELLGERPAPIHRRIVERLLPGPVTLQIELPPERLHAQLQRLGVEAGILDDGESIAVRVPDQATTRDILSRVEGPVVAQRLAASGVGPDDALHAGAVERARELGVSMFVDGGRCALRTPSTLIRLDTAGGYEVVREGALEKRYVERKLTRTILFICTGNTCRSPMAAAIAAHALEENGDGVPTQVLSAGVTAWGGQPANPEAIRALEEMGLPPGKHASRPLTLDLLRSAERIYAMTEGHRQAVLAMDPTARVETLDPDGQDVPDPIGLSGEVYLETARRIDELVRRRLRELEP